MYVTEDDSEGQQLIENMKAAGFAYVRTNLRDFQPKDPYKIATILHPALKNLSKMSANEKDNAYRIVDKLVKEMEPEIIPRLEPPQKIFKQNYLNEFCALQEDNSSEENTQNPSTFVDIYSPELRKYLSMNIKINDEFDLASWWLEQKEQFPFLFKIFMKYSSIPATSSVVESEFSYTGLVINDRRTRLLPENVNELMVARNAVNFNSH